MADGLLRSPYATMRPVDLAEAVYDYLRTHAGRDDASGRLVTHAPLHSWLIETFDMTASQAKYARTKTVKQLERQGRVRRDNRYSHKVWILS